MVLVLKGTRIVIPNKKPEAVLKLIHEGHLGLSKCKLHTKGTVYWPGLNRSTGNNWYRIVNFVWNIPNLSAINKLLSSLGQEILLHAWTKFATDIFHFERASYLLIVDYTSRFLVVCTSLSSMTEQHIATSLQASLFRIRLARNF